MVDNELIDVYQSRQRNQELDQLLPLLVKTSYDSTLNGLLLEHLFLNHKGSESQLEQYRQLAIKQIEKRFEKEGIQDQSLTIDQLTTKVQQQVELAEIQDKQLHQYKEQIQQYQEQLQQYKEHIHKAHSAIRDLKNQYEQLTIWMNELIQYMKENYSRLKSNESLIEDFAQGKPAPRGIHL